MKRAEQWTLSADSELRQGAEERIQRKVAVKRPPQTEKENMKTIHELQVHQIELEMQNIELRQTRDELETMLEKYTDLYDFAPVGYFSLDQNGTIRSANLSGALLLSTERSRLFGQRFERFITGTSRAIFADFIEKVFQYRDSKMNCEIMLLRDGHDPLFVHIDAIAFGSGQDCRIAVIDFTERRRAEELLRDKKLELEKVNRTLVEALNDLQLKDSMMIQQNRHAAMGEMISNIAHQWRQPLNTLGLYTQRLGMFFGSPTFTKEFLDTSVTRSMELIQYMSRTIDDFMNFFSKEQSRSEFQVGDAIKTALKFTESSFKERGIHIEWEEHGHVTIQGFANEYAQVLLNIFINARDAMNERNIEVPRIKVCVRTENGRSVVTISDNAGGIPEEIINKIFDPYFTTKGPRQGTGIGLFMSKTIIENSMGGTLSVRNTGEGAEFRIEV